MSEADKKRKKSKVGRKATKPSAKKLARSAIYEHAPATVALAEMFAVCDDVFTEEDAFSREHIQKSLGRLHRQWKITRGQLDPDFNPKRYPKRPRKASSTSSSTQERVKLAMSDKPSQRSKSDSGTTSKKARSGKKKDRGKRNG